jgi:hypothetical protein
MLRGRSLACSAWVCPIADVIIPWRASMFPRRPQGVMSRCLLPRGCCCGAISPGTREVEDAFPCHTHTRVEFRDRPAGFRGKPGLSIWPIVGTARGPVVGGLNQFCLHRQHVTGVLPSLSCVPASARGGRFSGGSSSEGGVRVTYCGPRKRGLPIRNEFWTLCHVCMD